MRWMLGGTGAHIQTGSWHAAPGCPTQLLLCCAMLCYADSATAQPRPSMGTHLKSRSSYPAWIWYPAIRCSWIWYPAIQLFAPAEQASSCSMQHGLETDSDRVEGGKQS